MKHSLLEQIKKQRLKLGLKQNDMVSRIGISRQQYQHLESKGNPTLDTLELIATGLNSELMLIPRVKLNAVKSALENGTTQASKSEVKRDLSEDPWQGLLGDDE